MPKTVYDIIKKQNGEKFAKAIRNYDNGIFDVPDLDKIVRYAGRDAEPIMEYLISLKDVHVAEMSVHQNPIDLLNRAGYDAYVVHDLDEQNAIKKYFADGEELCTFNDPSRFKHYYIINAVRKDVDKIRRADFANPKREDAYGTSVLSIQVLKNGGFISIKNRYNHTVENPDNTFNSNPDNIIYGLADAIRHYFHVDFSSRHVELGRGFVLVNNQIIKYNYEHNNVYVGNDFYVYDGQVYDIDKNHEILLDTVVFDTQSGEFRDLTNRISGTTQVLKKLIDGKKVGIKKNNSGEKSLVADGRPILDFTDGKITTLDLSGVTDVPPESFRFCGALRTLNMPDVRTIGNNSFEFTNVLGEINAPNLQVIGNRCFFDRVIARKLSFPQLQKIGDYAFKETVKLVVLDAPNLREIGADTFGIVDANFTKLDLPNLRIMGRYCFTVCLSLNDINLPQLKYMGKDCFATAQIIDCLDLPALETMGDECFHDLKEIKKLKLPNLSYMGEGAFTAQKTLKELDLPKLEVMGNQCFFENESIEKLSAPQLNQMGNACFFNNMGLKELNLPALKKMGGHCFFSNQKIKKINLPSVRRIDEMCFKNAEKAIEINMPRLQKIGGGCFMMNKKVMKKMDSLVDKSGRVAHGLIIILRNKTDLIKAVKKIMPDKLINPRIQHDR